MERLTVLVTGPGGRIGPHILPTFRERFNVKLLDRHPIAGEPDTIVADLSDKEVLKKALEGVDVLVHLAATSDEAPFIEELVPNNVVGLYNIFQAAHEAGVRRIVYASTVQTVGFHSHDRKLEPTELPRPVTLYGVTKVLGETMGRWYHDRHKMEFIAIRIGWFQDYNSPGLRNPHSGASRVWLSPKDCAGILTAAIEKPGLKYHIVFGTSLTVHEFLSRQPLRDVLGYEPQDDLRVLLPEIYGEKAV